MTTTREGADDAERLQIANVNGIPVVLGAASDETVVGGLVFRVGTADETPATSGITHLMEHLIAGAVHETLGHDNAQTRETETIFHMHGTLDEVVAHLNQICEVIRNPPLHRLEHERQLVRTEGMRQDGGNPLRVARYGALSYGISSLSELGITRITEAEIAAWIGKYLTAGNVVVFLSAPSVPAGLTLDLPPGPRHAMPEARQFPTRFPTYGMAAAGGIVVEGLVERSPASRVFARLLERDLYRELRERRPLSYAPRVAAVGRDGKCSHLTASADGLPEHLEELAAAFIDIVRSLGSREVSDDELSRAVQAHEASLTDWRGVGALPAHAITLLWGEEPRMASQLVAEARLVSASDIHRVATQLMQTGIFMVDPIAGGAVEQRGIGPFSMPEAPPLTGGKYFARVGVGLGGVRITEQGITAESPGQTAKTVLFADAPALVGWPDGGRRLMSPSGSWISIEPGLLQSMKSKHVRDLIDARMPPEKVIAMPERSPQEIPNQRKGRVAGFVVMGILVVFGLIMLVGTVVEATSKSWDYGILPFVFAVLFLGGAVFMWRSARGPRR